MLFRSETSTRTYPEIGVSDPHHPLTHNGGDPEKLARVAKINAFHVSLFAYFLQKLSTIQDGDGTLLDHSMMLFGSSLSDGDMHSPLDLPVVIAGRMNGALRGNEYLTWAPEKKVPMSNLWVTLLDKAGIRVPRLGDKIGRAHV